jgi:hypothetical protein
VILKRQKKCDMRAQNESLWLRMGCSSRHFGYDIIGSVYVKGRTVLHLFYDYFTALFVT